MRQKLMRYTFATVQEYQMTRGAIHRRIESVLQDLPDDEVTLVEIAINEALNNAFRYGSGQSSAPAVILSLFFFEPHCLLVRIKDSGKGFGAERTLSKVTSQECENSTEWQWGESGRGLFIMETIMDQVHYNAKGNAVSLLKNIVY